MFLGVRKGKALAASKKGGGNRPLPEDVQRRRIFAYAVVLLFAIAIVLLIMPGRAAGLSACQSIILSQQRYGCISELAASTSNISVCGYLPSQSADSCMLGIALAQRNITECGMISPSSQYYYTCIYNLSVSLGKPSDCSLLHGADADQCFYGMAKIGNFTQLWLCTSISNVSLRSSCGYVYDYRRAIEYRSAPSCGALPDIANGTVLFDIVEYGGGQSMGSLFESSVSGFTPRDFCYNQLATMEKNTSICSFASANAATFCQDQVKYAEEANTTASNRTVSCSNLSVPNLGGGANLNASESGYLRNLTIMGCTTAMAVSTKNITLCSEISNSTFYNSCVWGFIKTLNATGDCSYLTNTTLKGYCYSGYA